jgi:hypothetical protein
MPGYFFDSSALGKRYHQEVGTAHVEALFQASQPSRFISRLSVVELQSELARWGISETLRPEKKAPLGHHHLSALKSFNHRV